MSILNRVACEANMSVVNRSSAFGYPLAQLEGGNDVCGEHDNVDEVWTLPCQVSDEPEIRPLESFSNEVSGYKQEPSTDSLADTRCAKMRWLEILRPFVGRCTCRCRPISMSPTAHVQIRRSIPVLQVAVVPPLSAAYWESRGLRVRVINGIENRIKGRLDDAVVYPFQ